MFKRRKQRSVHESDFMKPCFLVNSSHLSLLADENILHHIIRATLLDVNSMYHINRQDTSAVGLLAVCLNPQKRVTGAAQTSQPRRKHEKTWDQLAQQRVELVGFPKRSPPDTLLSQSCQKCWFEGILTRKSPELKLQGIQILSKWQSIYCIYIDAWGW